MGAGAVAVAGAGAGVGAAGANAGDAGAGPVPVLLPRMLVLEPVPLPVPEPSSVHTATTTRVYELHFHSELFMIHQHWTCHSHHAVSGMSARPFRPPPHHAHLSLLPFPAAVSICSGFGSHHRQHALHQRPTSSASMFPPNSPPVTHT